MLSPAAKAKKAEYQRKWRRENPEKAKAQVERYWERKAQRESEDAKENE